MGTGFEMEGDGWRWDEFGCVLMGWDGMGWEGRGGEGRGGEWFGGVLVVWERKGSGVC